MKFYSLFTALLTSAFLISCAESDRPKGLIEAPSTPQSGGDSGSDNGGGGSDDSLDRTDLLGTWTKPCTNMGTVGFRQDSLVIGATTVQIRMDFDQTDSTCRGNPDLEARGNFTYTTPAFQPLVNTNIDLVLKTIKAKIKNTAAVATANAASFCGFNDWAVDVEKDVTGRDCIQDMPAANKNFYQILRLETAHRLFVGALTEAQDGSDPSKRPTNLESVPFTK
jgi:hypothetical protein